MFSPPMSPVARMYYSPTYTIPSDHSPPLNNPLQFNSSPSMSDFQIEHAPRQYSPKRVAVKREDPEVEAEMMFRESVSKLLVATTRPFTVSGRVPFDPAGLVLFFRSQSGISHSLDFPIDVEHDTPPALDVLIAACQPYSPNEGSLDGPESLFYPPNLPLTTTLELSNHPIMDAVRTTLFPSLPAGHYLSTLRDKLEVVVAGGSLRPPLPTDGRVATICIALPVRYRGGALVVRDGQGNEEQFFGRGGKSGDMEWTAFLAGSDFEVESVLKGCRIAISYAIYLRTFGPSGVQPDPLISPSDYFLDLLAPVLNVSRGRRIAFYLSNEYAVNPGEVLADSLVPHLKGGDSILYHALKLYKLNPELHWTAGGYIWPVDRIVECGNDLNVAKSPKSAHPTRMPFSHINGDAPRGFSIYAEPAVAGGENEVDNMRWRVEDSGAIPLTETDIAIITDGNTVTAGKERVPFASGGELEKLVVNTLLVAFVP